MRVIVCMCMLHVNNPYDVKNSFDLINVKENLNFLPKKSLKKHSNYQVQIILQMKWPGGRGTNTTPSLWLIYIYKPAFKECSCSMCELTHLLPFVAD